MTTLRLEQLLGEAARDLLTSIDSGQQGSAVRTQAAIVRSLVDEIDHRHESDVCVGFLRDQAKEELLRLMDLMKYVRPASAAG